MQLDWRLQLAESRARAPAYGVARLLMQIRRSLEASTDNSGSMRTAIEMSQ